MGHKYNFVVFNGYDGLRASPYNEDGYYSICMRDLWDDEDILISNHPMDYACPVIKYICGKYTHPRLKLPFKQLWYPFFFKNKFKNDKPFCFISIGFKWPASYMKWLKKKYPDAIFVRFIRDLVSTQQYIYDSYKDAGVIDYWITYDENEAKKYGMLYFNEVESKIKLDESRPPICDVFFAGNAKKRLPQIVAAYDALEKAGLKCLFLIMGTKPEDRIERKGIEYRTQMLTYRQMLEYNMRAKCLLEINQEGAIGYTSRFLESVLYNKLLLTDNMSIMNTPFYNSKFMQCFDTPDKINPDFINNYADVDYGYKDEFSPKHLIEFIEKL